MTNKVKSVGDVFVCCEQISWSKAAISETEGFVIQTQSVNLASFLTLRRESPFSSVAHRHSSASETEVCLTTV